jgi:Cu/Zn superoxide dismutase
VALLALAGGCVISVDEPEGPGAGSGLQGGACSPGTVGSPQWKWSRGLRLRARLDPVEIWDESRPVYLVVELMGDETRRVDVYFDDRKEEELACEGRQCRMRLVREGDASGLPADGTKLTMVGFDRAGAPTLVGGATFVRGSVRLLALEDGGYTPEPEQAPMPAGVCAQTGSDENWRLCAVLAGVGGHTVSGSITLRRYSGSQETEATLFIRGLPSVTATREAPPDQHTWHIHEGTSCRREEIDRGHWKSNGAEPDYAPFQASQGRDVETRHLFTSPVLAVSGDALAGHTVVVHGVGTAPREPVACGVLQPADLAARDCGAPAFPR